MGVKRTICTALRAVVDLQTDVSTESFEEAVKSDAYRLDRTMSVGVVVGSTELSIRFGDLYEVGKEVFGQSIE